MFHDMIRENLDQNIKTAVSLGMVALPSKYIAPDPVHGHSPLRANKKEQQDLMFTISCACFLNVTPEVCEEYPQDLTATFHKGSSASTPPNFQVHLFLSSQLLHDTR